MALNASKTILLEKQYLYVKASKGFQLEGTNIEKIWVNTGYYRFLVDNVSKALSNSYVNVLYDSTDIDFIAYCSDLFMEEIQNSVVTAVENLETYLQQFAQQNHDDFGSVQDTLDELNTGLSGAMQSIVARMSKVFPSLSEFDFNCVISSSSSVANIRKPAFGNSQSMVSKSDLEVGKIYLVYVFYSTSGLGDLFWNNFCRINLYEVGDSNDVAVIFPDGTSYVLSNNSSKALYINPCFSYFYLVRFR